MFQQPGHMSVGELRRIAFGLAGDGFDAELINFSGGGWRKYNLILQFRKESEKVSGFVGEIVRGIRDIKLLHAEDSFTNELHEDVKKLNSMRYEMNSVNRNYRLLRGNSHDIFDLGMIVLLVYLIVEGNLAVANALVIYNYVGRVASIIDWVGILVEKVKDFNLSSSRIFAIMKNDEFKKEKFGTKHLDHVNGDFSFSHVPPRSLHTRNGGFPLLQ